MRKKPIEQTLREHKLSPDRANPAERGEFQLTDIDLKFPVQSLTSQGFSGMGLSRCNPSFEELPAAWQRYLGCIAVIVDATVRDPQKRKVAKAASLEQAQDAPWGTPPHMPEELGTPEEFGRRWQDGEGEISLGAVTHRSQIVSVQSTGLREFLDAQPGDPEDALPIGKG